MTSPAELADHHAIVQLTHAYCWALDERDWDTLRRVFTADAVTDLGAGGQNGIDEIIERVSSALARFDLTQHQVATHQIQVDGDTATGRCYLHAQHVRDRDDTTDLLMIGAKYVDDYMRSPEGWRIAKRDIVFLWMERSEGRRSDS